MKKILEFLHRFFTSLKLGASKFIDKIATPAIEFVDQLKLWIDAPGLDIAVQLTTTPIDNEILAALRKILPLITSKLHYVADVQLCFEKQTDAEMISCLIDVIKSVKPEWKDDVFRLIATEIAKSIDSHDLTQSQINMLIELAYNNKKHL